MKLLNSLKKLKRKKILWVCRENIKRAKYDDAKSRNEAEKLGMKAS